MITMAKPVAKHGFFDIPNLLPAVDNLVGRVKPKLNEESPDSVGFISSGDVAIDLEPIQQRKEKKSHAVKRKGKNTHTTKRKKRGKK